MTDQQIIEKLKEIDESAEGVSKWEAKFLNTVIVQKTLSAKQREVALNMIEKYL